MKERRSEREKVMSGSRCGSVKRSLSAHSIKAREDLDGGEIGLPFDVIVILGIASRRLNVPPRSSQKPSWLFCSNQGKLPVLRRGTQ
jgi:hypothetical protein